MEATAFDTFLGYGTTLLEWIITGAGKIITFLMSNPVTASYLVLGLIVFVVSMTRSFTHGR